MSQPHKGCVFGLLLTSFAACSLNAQARTINDPSEQAAAPAIKVETRVVLVDVVVTDHKGETIAGLRPESFRIEEDGHPQAISAFEEHKRSTSAPVELPPLPPNVYTNLQRVKSSDSVNLLLIDMLNTQPWFQKDVCNQAIKFLATVRPGTRLAIFTLNDQQLRLVRGFTTDFSGLAAALDGSDSRVIPESSWLNPSPSQRKAEKDSLDAMIMMQASPLAVDEVKQYLEQEAASKAGARSELTLQAFQHLARYLSGIPARKNVIWLADRFPINFTPQNKVHTPNHQLHVQQTSDMLTAAQVAIYPVSARGLLGLFQLDELGLTREEVLNELSSSQIGAETVAEETGGRAFYNTNGLDAAMSKAVDEGSHYYTLAYAPSNAKNDGKYRHIEVKLPDGNYRLAYRRGYYADKPAGQAQGQETAAADDLLMPLVGFGMPNFDQITFQLEATLIYPQPGPGARRAGLNTELKDPIVRYAADLAVFAQGLGMETAADGMKRGKLEIMLIAYDRSGKIVNIAKRSQRFALTAQGYAEVQANGLPLHLEIDVPPSDIYLRTGVYDFGSGNAGTLGLPLHAPPAPVATK